MSRQIKYDDDRIRSYRDRSVNLQTYVDVRMLADIVHAMRLHGALAKELTESCLSFSSIWDLDDECLKTVVSQVQPAILGLALSLVHVKNQRRALSLISREMAMKAFEIMQKYLTGNRSECNRAQQKILDLAVSLQRNRIIQFY